MTDFDKYRYGALAQRFLGSQESAKFVDGALFVLADEMGLGDDSDGFVEGTLASQEGIEKASSVYSGKFNKGFNAQNASEMGFYSGALAGLSTEDQDKIKKVFTDQSGKTYQAIQEEFMKAAYTVQAPKGMFPDADIDVAKKTLKKYQDFAEMKTALDDYAFEGLRGKAVDVSRKRNLEGRASKL